MTVEVATYISQLDPTLPTASDPKSEGDNQFRMLKTVLQTQFPNFGTNAITATATQINYLVGVTSAVQTQLDTLTSTKAAKSGSTYTGAHDFSGASSVTVPTATVGDSSTKAASTAFVAATAFASALPAQTGNAGKILNTDGTTATWTDTITTSKTISGNLTFSGTARRMYGDFENFTRASRFMFTNSGSSSQAALGVLPSTNGGKGGSYEAFARNDPDNSAVSALFCDQLVGRAGVDSGKNGTGTTLPLAFTIDGNEALQIDTSKNVRVTGGGALGYGTGSGGAVTQLTSKATSVTLNKSCGTITTHNAALAAGAMVSFNCICSFVGTGDTVVINESSATGINGDNYRIEVSQMSAGFFKIRVTNISGGSLSDAIPINYSVIKCVSA